MTVIFLLQLALPLLFIGWIALGNSGNTGEPHLHIHAQERGTLNQPLSGDPLPMHFDGRYLVRNDRVVTH